MTNSLLKSEAGGALMITMMIMIMITIIGILALSNATNGMDLSFNKSHQDAAFYLAEAGVKRAFVDLNMDNEWRDGYTEEPLGDGTYTVWLIDADLDAGLDDTVLIRAEGDLRQMQAGVELWTAPEYYHPFTWGMFAGSGLNFDQATCTDSYNSDSGSYFETVLQLDGDIGTNGSITTSKSVTIGGDAYTAIGGSIDIGAGTLVFGDTSTSRDSVYLDIIPPEEYDWAEANSDALSGMSGYDYTYDSDTKVLTTDAGATITLQSGIYYFSSIDLAAESDISLAPGAEVVIYVSGDIVFGQYSTINADGVPAQLQVYSEGGTLQFDQYNIFCGAFYGPEAVIQYDQTTEVYGSLVADFIQLDAGACFHYDRDLANLKHNKTGRMLEIAWREF